MRTAQATAARRRITFPLRSHLSLLQKVGECLSNAVGGFALSPFLFLLNHSLFLSLSTNAPCLLSLSLSPPRAVTVRQLENFSRRAGVGASSTGCFFSLTGIYCRRHELSGPILPELGQLSNLKVLDLCSNEFEGMSAGRARAPSYVTLRASPLD